MRAKISNLVKTIKKRQSGSCAAAQCPHSRQISSELQKWDCGQKLTALSPIGLAHLPLEQTRQTHLQHSMDLANLDCWINVGLIIIIMTICCKLDRLAFPKAHVQHTCYDQALVPDVNQPSQPSRTQPKEMRCHTRYEMTSPS